MLADEPKEKSKLHTKLMFLSFYTFFVTLMFFFYLQFGFGTKKGWGNMIDSRAMLLIDW